MNRGSGDRLLELQKSFPSLSICLGIHPEYPQYFGEFDEVKKQILQHRDKIVAIGEIGLPYYCLEDLSEDKKVECIEAAKELLIKFLDLASLFKFCVGKKSWGRIFKGKPGSRRKLGKGIGSIRNNNGWYEVLCDECQELDVNRKMDKKRNRLKV